MYFELIFIILKCIYKEYSLFTVLKQSWEYIFPWRICLWPTSWQPVNYPATWNSTRSPFVNMPLRGQIPAIRIGHLWRFDKDAIDYWIRKDQNEPEIDWRPQSKSVLKKPEGWGQICSWLMFRRSAASLTKLNNWVRLKGKTHPIKKNNRKK